jgi:predicted TIM-barrel fold metal-dependent hydrolase
MLSGLFDIYPNLRIIVGHLGEGLPFLLPRLQHRMDEQRYGEKGNKAKQRPSYYFARNFWLTTSGHFHARQMHAVLEQIGVERILFSVDYPLRADGRRRSLVRRSGARSRKEGQDGTRERQRAVLAEARSAIRKPRMDRL